MKYKLISYSDSPPPTICPTPLPAPLMILLPPCPTKCNNKDVNVS